MENNYNFYLKKFKVALSILVGALLLFIVLIAKTIPQIGNVFSIQNQYKTKSLALKDAERTLETLKQNEAQKEAESKTAIKAIFKPITMGLDTESAISDEFGEILQIMRENKIKTRSIVYDYDPADDNFVKNSPSQYHVCRITAQMIATYSDFENFLRNLYKHEHFLDISKIEIVPYQKNKRILLISLQIKLYAQSDGSDYNPQTTSEPNAEQKSDEQDVQQ